MEAETRKAVRGLIIEGIILFIMLILVISIILVYISIKSDGGKCIRDPLGYAQQKLSNESICSCYLYGEGINPGTSYCANKCNYSVLGE